MRFNNGSFELRNFLIRIVGFAPAKVGSLLLPTMASSILTIQGYTDFALVYVIGMAVSAFSGESLSASVSKHVQNSNGVLHGFLVVGSIIFLVTAALTSLGYLFSINSLEMSASHLKILAGIYLLCAFNIFVPSSLNLILFYENSIRIISVIVLAVLSAITMAYVFGHSVGYVGFMAGYSMTIVLVLLTILRLLTRNLDSSINSAPEKSAQLFRSYFAIAIAAGFGGPVHGICMVLLGGAEGVGRFELAVFVLYYPFAMLVSFVPSLNSAFVIRLLSDKSKTTSRRNLSDIFLGNTLLMAIVGVPLLIASPLIHQYYENRLGVHVDLIPVMVAIGFLIGLFSVSSSIIISLRSPRDLLTPSLIQALFYVGTTYFGVTYFKFNALNVALTLGLSLLILLILHGFLILQNDSHQ